MFVPIAHIGESLGGDFKIFMVNHQNMSVDLSGAEREIMYVNFTTVGSESENGNQNYCTAMQTYRDAPLIYQQNQWLVAATRWQVPTSEVPTIDEKWFEVWGYVPVNHVFPDAGEEKRDDYVAPTTFAQFAALENEWLDPDYQASGAHKQAYFRRVKRCDVPAAHSAFQWFGLLESILRETIAGTSYSSYGDRIKFVMLPDMRVQVWISDTFQFTPAAGQETAVAHHDQRWYIKMSRGMFDMCQFQISSLPVTDDQGNVTGAPETNLGNHGGYRFFGSGQGDRQYAEYAGVVLGGNEGKMKRHYVISTSATSAADMFNSHKKLVLVSDLITKQERSMAAFGTRKRQLVEYDLTQPTNMSYSINRVANGLDPYGVGGHISVSTGVSEPLPSARTYTNRNTDGRWMQMSSPSPLYQLEVTALLICWDFENRQFVQKQIPVPAGGVFDLKLAFINRDKLFEGKDHHHR